MDTCNLYIGVYVGHMCQGIGLPNRILSFIANGTLGTGNPPTAHDSCHTFTSRRHTTLLANSGQPVTKCMGPKAGPDTTAHTECSTQTIKQLLTYMRLLITAPIRCHII